MARVVELDEEIERDVDGAGDVFFSRVGEPVPLTSPPSPFDLSDPPRNPIAVSFSARLLFVAMSQGFMVAEMPEVIRMAKESKEKGKGPSVSDSCFLDVKIGKVSIVALSVDSLWLAAVVGCDVRFYSVENLRNKESKFSFLCSIKSGVVKDFRWQKNTGNVFAILSSDGLLQLGQFQAPLKDVMNNVDAVDWSENGAFIAVARKNTLSILSLDLKEQCQMKLLFQSWSDGTDSECSIKVDSINWLRNNSIVIGCVRLYEDGKEEGYLVQVIAVGELEFTERSSKPIVFSFPDLFEDISDDILPAGCGPYLFASYLKHLGLTLASFQKAIGAHLVLLRWSLDDDRREAVSLEYENEIYTPRIDLQENGDDNLILGFVVDQTPSNEKVRVKIEAEFKEVFPNYTLWCLTSEGKLIMFHILRASDDSYTPETCSSEDYKSVTEGTSAALSLKHQLPAVTLGLNDSAEVKGSEPLQRLEKGSEPLQRLEKVSNGNDMALTGKEVQGSTNSNVQLYSGRTLNAEKLPVVSSRMQDPGLVLAINAKTCIQKLSSCPPGQTVSATLPVGNLSNEAFTTMQAGTGVLGQNVEKELAGSTCRQEAAFGSQTTGKFGFSSNSSAKSSSSALDRSVLGNIHSAKIGSENKLPSSQHGPISGDSLPGERPFSWKESSSSPPPSLFYENKAIQSERAKSFLVKKGSPEPLPAMHKPLPIMQQSSTPGKSLNSMTQPSINSSRNPRCPWMAEPEPELSKQFYNVKDMAKELDKLLSFIEREGGFRDACTISQESSLSTLEDGLKNLSIMSQVHKNKIEKQLLEIQQLQNKMLQVSTRQVYVEGLVKQASNDQYWDIWKRKKLSPELDLKRQHILDTYQSLTDQLIGLGRHFNNLESSKFGEQGGVHAGRRALHANADPSRNVQPVQKVYNTLNSQLAAAEQLSNCLSEQMAMLNINKQSVRHPTVVKELFESIGLSQEASIFHSPESIKRTSMSASISKINMSSTSQVLESGTARRRYSLDKSLSKFEPQKTTVKRMLLKERAVSVIADKHVGRSQEAFHSQTARYETDPQKSNENHVSSFSQPSSLKWHSLAHPTGKGIQEKPPKTASEPQSVSPFKWTLELSGSSQNLKSNSHTGQLSSSMVFYNNTHGIADGKFQLPDTSSNIVTHTASQSGSSMVSKTAPSSKRMSNVPFNTSSQTSMTFPSSCTPIFKTTLPSEIVHEQTSGQLNQQSGKDDPTKLSVRSSDNFGVSENGLFSLSDESVHSMRSVVQSVDRNRIAQVDVLTGHSASPEPSSITPFNSLASASTPVFPIKQSSTSLASTHSSASISPIFPSLPTNSSESISSSSLPASAMTSIRKTLFDTEPINDTNKIIPVPSSVLTPSTPPQLPSSNPLTVQAHEFPVPQPSAIPFESAVSHSPPLQANIPKSKSESAPFPASKSEGLLQPTEINPLSKAAVSQAPAIKVSAGLSKGSSVIPTAGFSTFPSTSGPLQIQSTAISPLSTIPQEKDESIDLSSSQEDEMEEEAPSMPNEFLGGIGGFGLGTASPNIPKSNPFGVSFNTTPASAPFSLTTSPGELFRPASFSIPPPKPIELSQPTQSGATSSGFGGGFSGFGQPANIGAGQQALGSVLGAFGQSRQIGAGAQGAAGGFAGVSPGVGFASAATGVGFASAATGGFAGAAPGGGFASAAPGGGFASAATGGGFAAAAAGGGFAAVGSKGGGFAAAASGGGGYGGANPGGGFAGGGFGGFSSNNGSGFSGFGGNNAAGAGGPPSQLFTQMRK